MKTRLINVPINLLLLYYSCNDLHPFFPLFPRVSLGSWPDSRRISLRSDLFRRRLLGKTSVFPISSAFWNAAHLASFVHTIKLANEKEIYNLKFVNVVLYAFGTDFQVQHVI